jgi:hypothetical protein
MSTADTGARVASSEALSRPVCVALVLLGVAAGNRVWTSSDARTGSYQLTVKLRDASGLPPGSKVVVAGLAKGQVTDLEVEGGYTRVTFKVSHDIDIYQNSVVFKRTSSLLGESYLEIDRGKAHQQMPDGSTKTFEKLGPECDGYDSPDDEIAEPCKRVPIVVDLGTPDQMLRRIEQSAALREQVLRIAEELQRTVVDGASDDDGFVRRHLDTLMSILRTEQQEP